MIRLIAEVSCQSLLDNFVIEIDTMQRTGLSMALPHLYSPARTINTLPKALASAKMNKYARDVRVVKSPMCLRTSCQTHVSRRPFPCHRALPTPGGAPYHLF